jgi:hypothetical protein
MESTITKSSDTKAFDSAMAILKDITERKKKPANANKESASSHSNEFDVVTTPFGAFNFGSLSQSVPDLGTWCVLLKAYADR